MRNMLAENLGNLAEKERQQGGDQRGIL